MREDESNYGQPISIQSVVLATDFLESSRLALDYAVAFAHRFGATLTISHAVVLSNEAQEVELLDQRSSVSREHLLSRLEALATGVRRLGISTKIELREGEPCASVNRSVIENKADLLVLGTHGIYRGLEHVFIGSNAEKILLSAPCPTLTVGKHVMAGIDLDLKFRRILIVSDLLPESVSATRYAVSLAQKFGLVIEFLPVLTDDAATDSREVREAAERFCNQLGSLPNCLGDEWSDSAHLLKVMASRAQVMERAMKFADGLLILGVHNESAWKRHLHASFAFELVALSICPVLTIHREKQHFPS